MPSRLIDNIQIKYLADVPEFISVLAQWSYDAWSQYDPSLSIEQSVGSLIMKLNRDKIPLVFVAIYNSNPIATVTLKEKIKIPGYEDRDLWLGSLWVEEEYRKQGIGQCMLDCAYNKAHELGYTRISLFASDPVAAAWYIKYGWRKFAVDTFNHHEVALLEHVLP